MYLQELKESNQRLKFKKYFMHFVPKDEFNVFEKYCIVEIVNFSLGECRFLILVLNAKGKITGVFVIFKQLTFTNL